MSASILPKKFLPAETFSGMKGQQFIDRLSVNECPLFRVSRRRALSMNPCAAGSGVPCGPSGSASLQKNSPSSVCRLSAFSAVQCSCAPMSREFPGHVFFTCCPGMGKNTGASVYGKTRKACHESMTRGGIFVAEWALLRTSGLPGAAISVSCLRGIPGSSRQCSDAYCIAVKTDGMVVLPDIAP